MKKITIFLCLLLCLFSFSCTSANNVKLIALTFDDGPSYEFTPQALDALKERGAKATFFLVGQWLPGKDAIVDRIKSEGHQIGSHTYNHINLTCMSSDEVKNELARFQTSITEMAGITDCMLRPPFGKYNDIVCSVAGVPLIHWSIDPAAGKTVPGAKMADMIVSQAFDGAIILMHDTTAENITAVCEAMDRLIAKGYEFVTVNELFRLKGVQPIAGKIYHKVQNPCPEYFDESKLASHWAFEAIEYVQKNGIMQGDGHGFKPNEIMTRAMAVTVLWRMAGSPDSGFPAFCDVPDNTWYSHAVAWAQENGIVNGYSQWYFGPNDNVTREQFYCILDRYIRTNDNFIPTKNGVSYGDDNRISNWAINSVMTIRNLGFESLNDIEIFRARDNITRAEAAELLAWCHKLTL